METPYDGVGPQTLPFEENAFTGVTFTPLADNIAPGHLSYAQNLYVDRDGSARSVYGYSTANVMPDGTASWGSPIAGLNSLDASGAARLIFAAASPGAAGGASGKLWSLLAKTGTEIKLPSSTSFAFASGGRGVQMARVGKWLVGVPGAGGGNMFRTDGINAYELPAVFSLATAPSLSSAAQSVPVGVAAVGWTFKQFVGDDAAERNFSADGTTLDAKWNVSGGAAIDNYLDANAERCIELDNNAGAESVETDATGSSDIPDNFAALSSPHAGENHLFVVEFEAAAEDSEAATPAIPKDEPWAYVDVTVTPYSDAGTTAIAGGAITIRSGPHAEQVSGKERLIFDFRGLEERTGTQVNSYKLRFANPHTALHHSGGVPGIDVNRVYWYAPERAFRVQPPTTGSTPAWNVFQGTQVAQGGTIYTGGGLLQVLDLVPSAATATRNLATRAWRLSVGIRKDEAISSFRARAWVIVGTSATSTYGTKSRVFSTNTVLVDDATGFYLFEFAKAGSDGWILQAGIELLDDVAAEGAGKFSDIRLFQIDHADLTGRLLPQGAYQYRISFADTAATTYPLASGYEGPASPAGQLVMPAWAAHAQFSLGPYSKPSQQCTRMLVWRAGGAYDDGVFRLVAMLDCSGTASDATGRWSYVSGVFTDYLSDEDLFTAPRMTLGIDNPPTAGEVILYHDRRVWVGKGAQVWVSHLLPSGDEPPIYFTQVPLATDPEVESKGALFPLDPSGGTTRIFQLLPYQDGVLAWTNRGPVYITGKGYSTWDVQHLSWDQGYGIFCLGAATLDTDGVIASTGRGIVRLRRTVRTEAGGALRSEVNFDPIDASLSGLWNNLEWADTGVGLSSSIIWLRPFGRDSIKSRARLLMGYKWDSAGSGDAAGLCYNQETASWGLFTAPVATSVHAAEGAWGSLGFVGCADGKVRQLLEPPVDEVTYLAYSRLLEAPEGRLLKPFQIDLEVECPGGATLTLFLFGEDGWRSVDAGALWVKEVEVYNATRRLRFSVRDIPRSLASSGIMLGVQAVATGAFALRGWALRATVKRVRRVARYTNW